MLLINNSNCRLLLHSTKQIHYYYIQQNKHESQAKFNVTTREVKHFECLEKRERHIETLQPQTLHSTNSEPHTHHLYQRPLAFLPVFRIRHHIQVHEESHWWFMSILNVILSTTPPCNIILV